MLDILKNKIDKIKEEYSDIRWEDNYLTRIVYSGKELKYIGSSLMSGGHIRVLCNGGIGTNSFNNINNLDKYIDISSKAAKIMSTNTGKKIKLSPYNPVVDKITVKPKIDPRDISLEDKHDLVKKYNELILSYEGIKTTNISYIERLNKKLFVNNEGSILEQEELFVYLGCGITARSGNIIQSISLGFGASDDYSKLLNRDEEIKKAVENVLKLVKAKPVKAGIYTAILNNDMTGVFIHEAFGHLSEADITQRNKDLREKMLIGKRIGKPILNIIDDSTIPGAPGTFYYDDDGVKGQKTYLVRDGILVGRLHSRETATDFNEPITGNSRAVDYKFSPIVRMSNIFIDNGTSSLDDLISSVKHGIYLIDSKGGQTIGDQFSFGAQYGYMIENGKITEMVRDINVSGNLFETLENISGIGNDLKISEKGGCGKSGGDGGQLMYKSGYGGPHIRVDKVIIGGIN